MYEHFVYKALIIHTDILEIYVPATQLEKIRWLNKSSSSKMSRVCLADKYEALPDLHILANLPPHPPALPTDTHLQA